MSERTNLDGVLIAGGAGFVGAHLARLLLDQGVRVASLDNGTFEPSRALERIRGRRDFVEISGDAGDQRSWNSQLTAFGRVSAVVNCVGPARPSYYRSHPTATMYSLVQSAFALAKWATHHDAILVHASSSEVYGSLGAHPISEGDVGAVDTLSVRAPYAEAKRAAETIVWNFAREFGLKN